MSYASKIFILILNLLLLNFQILFSQTKGSSDSLKIGLVLTTSKLNNIDSLSAQIIGTFSKCSDFNIVLIDPALSLSIDPFAPDSVVLAALQQEKFHGLILCEFLVEDSIRAAKITAMKANGINPGDSTKFEFVTDDFSSELDPIVRKLVAYFQSQERPLNGVRVMLTGLKISGTDSIFVNYRQALIDSFISIFQSPRFANIQIKAVKFDSAESPIQQYAWNDSSSDSSLRPQDVDLIISGKIDYDDEKCLAYFPIVEINENYESAHHQFEKSETLTGKTCLIDRFSLNPVTVAGLNPISDFVVAYISFQNKRYTDAIEQLKNNSSLVHHFYLAESYLHRGLTYQHDLAAARADWDSCLIYLNKSLSHAESLSDSSCINNNLGVSYQMLGLIDSAVVSYSKAYTDLKSNSLVDGFVRAANNLGNIYLLRGRWNDALDIFQSGVEFMEQGGDSLNLAATYENLAIIYQLIMQRTRAITYYNRALEIRKAMDDRAGMARSYFYLGDVYQEMNDFEKAKEFYRQDLAFNTILHNEPRLAETYDRLARVFQQSQVQDSALVYFQKSYDTFEMLDDWHGLTRSLVHQAAFRQKQKNFEQAITLYERALRLAMDNNSKPDLAKIYDRLGDIYNFQDNLISAYDHYEQAAAIYEQLENFETLSLILFNMGLIQLKQHDYDGGYELLKRAVAIDQERGFNHLNGEKDFLKQLEGILGKN